MNDQDKINRYLQSFPVELHNQFINCIGLLKQQYEHDELIPSCDDQYLSSIIKLLICSEFAAKSALNNWEWFIDQINQKKFNKSLNEKILKNLFSQIDKGDVRDLIFNKKIRSIRNRCLLHILWRDIICDCDLSETLSALSLLADFCITSATRYASTVIESRFGFIPFEGGKMSINVLAMGKLGGNELNFSSDVDLIFLYPENAESNGKDKLSGDEYFARIARKIVSILNDNLEDGFVYRVDTRLRPFGESGHLVHSYAAFENYLMNHGRAWERYAYVKARLVYIGEEIKQTNSIINSVIKPFVFRKYLDYGILESLRELKQIIAKEVLRKKLSKDIKLGPGGIREIEFIVQSIQIIRGGNSPLLRQPGLKRALDQAIKERDLEQKIGEKLYLAYVFLRRLENYIQCIKDQQTHKIPESTDQQLQLALMMGYEDWERVKLDHIKHKEFVSEQFSAIVFRGQGEVQSNKLNHEFKFLVKNDSSQEEWREIFIKKGALEANNLSKVIFDFLSFLKLQKIDKTTQKRLEQLLPQILSIVIKHQQSDLILKRIVIILYQVLRRSAYIAFLNENNAALIRLIFLCEKSIYLTEMIARAPLLLDEILNPSEDNLEKLSSELSKNIKIQFQKEAENKIELISRFQRNAIFHLAIADLDGNIPIMKVSDKLTQVAEITISQALKLAYEELLIKHGEPEYIIDGIRKKANFGVVAYGKLGGLELSYGSDLDLVFLHDSEGEKQITNSENSIGNNIFFSRLAQKLIFLLTTQTATGALYDIDTRLRPSGKSGLLISSINAFKNYQKNTAWTWEHQALLRSRLVVGNEAINNSFDSIRLEVLTQSIKLKSLRNDVLSMREKMRLQLDQTNNKEFDLKNGAGGIGDIEFIVQFLVLTYAQIHPKLVIYTDNIRQLDALYSCGVVSKKHQMILQNIYKLYRKKVHLLSLDMGSNLVDIKFFASEINTVIGIWNYYFLEK